MSTPFHARFWAYQLQMNHPTSGEDGMNGLGRTMSDARVDLNPHQIDAALFALRSPLSKGVLLADEVGLGKTIEASLVLSQKWAENKRKLLLIVPATLRKQWQVELETKFFLPSIILETKSFNDDIRRGMKNPFDRRNQVIICSYDFIYRKKDMVKKTRFDLVVADEAHRLRNVYKETKTQVAIAEAIRDSKKLLLTATPLQNSLLELYGLLSILDPDLFGSLDGFEAQYVSKEGGEGRDAMLKERLKHVCKRTLRNQVKEYINFTNRFAHTADFFPSETEQRLYEEVSEYLRRPDLAALPKARRTLMTQVLRKLLASSPAAIGATLSKFAARLRLGLDDKKKASDEESDDALLEEVAQDFDALPTMREELPEREETNANSAMVVAADPGSELAELDRFVEMAASIAKDAKAQKLIEALPVVFEKAVAKGAARKAVIFTESCQTQRYLLQLLEENGYRGEIVLLNGTNTDELSKQTYEAWKQQNAERWSNVTSGSKSADMKAAIVEKFKGDGTLLIATESAAEGINLQFCSVVINYDLPWNPQRVEQRIGRCHRYGQKSDVLVVNMLNRNNEADRRVFDLLSEKFKLFDGVFGASDTVLGAVESGIDLEKHIADIYQTCRTSSEIKSEFDKLQLELEQTISQGMASAKQRFLENFDAEVHKKLQVHKEKAKEQLNERQQMLLDLARYSLTDRASCESSAPRFLLNADAADEHSGSFNLDWQRAEAQGDVFFRVGHPLAKRIMEDVATGAIPEKLVEFTYDPHASALEPFVGKTGWLQLSKLTTESLERLEDYLLFSAVTDDGQPLAPELAKKLFSLVGKVNGSSQSAPQEQLQAICEQLRNKEISDLGDRNESFFQEEMDKIEQRSEDLKAGLEQEVKRLDKDITALNKESRRVRGIMEKIEMQKRVVELEVERSKKKESLEKERLENREYQSRLIKELEGQLKNQKFELNELMTFQWRLTA